jgi:chorismate dehydratase
MRIGRIPYINCYPVYGALDRGVVKLDAELVDGVPTDLNRRMAVGELDISVVSALEYARDSGRYLLLPDLAISCDGPVRSVMLFSARPASDLGGRRVIVSRSSMTSVALLELLFDHVWHVKPHFVPGDSELSDVALQDDAGADARLVIGDAALLLGSRHKSRYTHSYDLGEEWKEWTGQPFVFAVWVAQRTANVKAALIAHAALIESRNWGLDHLPDLARQARETTGVDEAVCTEYLSGLDYGLSYPHLAGLTEFYRRLVERGRIPNGTLTFLPAA